jgi:hypothetical protein
MATIERTPLPRPAERRRRIRRRTIASSLVAFAAIWGVIFGQLASGRDPALANNPDKQQPAATSAPATYPNDKSDSTAPQRSAPLNPVTTQQS